MLGKWRFIALVGIIFQLSGCYIVPRPYEKFAIEKPEPERPVAKETSPEKKVVIELQHEPSPVVVSTKQTETIVTPAPSCKPPVQKKKRKKKSTKAVAACG